MKPLDYVTPEPRGDERDWYTADPDVAYPAALAYAQELLEPDAAVPMYLRPHVARLAAANLPAEVWTTAEAAPDQLAPLARAQRAEVLECARLIFTARLREQVGDPLGLHISAGDRWRL